MAKVNVYIDGFNFYYGAVKGSPYKWLDLGALCRRILPNDDVQAIEYFTAIVSARPYDPDLPVRQQMYLRALKTVPNLRIVYGHFLTHSCRMLLTGSNPPKKVWVDKTEEKGSDVNIAAHLLRDAYNHAFEVAVVVTNDSDLVEPADRQARTESSSRNPEPASVPQRGIEERGDLHQANPAIRCRCLSVSQRNGGCKRAVSQAGNLVVVLALR